MKAQFQSDHVDHLTARRGRDEDEVPIVQVDQYFMNKKGDSDILALLNCADFKSGSVASCVCDKEPEFYAVEMVVQLFIYSGRVASS